MYRKNSRSHAYLVTALFLSVQLLSDVQTASDPVHGEEGDRRHVSSWTCDAVEDSLAFIFTGADLKKNKKQNSRYEHPTPNITVFIPVIQNTVQQPTLKADTYST